MRQSLAGNVPTRALPATWRVIRPELTGKQPTPLRPGAVVVGLNGQPVGAA
jgi:hypothetical protein